MSSTRALLAKTCAMYALCKLPSLSMLNSLSMFGLPRSIEHAQPLS